MNYRTPGVYVEEIETFPPSVAQVETAIPAFIGYTAEGQKNKPTRITSMLEYEELFGEANPETFAVVFTEGVATATQTKVSDFKMYYALQMYFANGGGPCYIVSVGDYGDEVTTGTLLDGLELLKKEDEPTLIIFPDLQNLVPTAAEVDAAEEAAQIAEDNEEVANKAKTAAAIAAAAVATVVDDNGDLEDAIAAALDVVDNYPVTDLNNLERVAENQAVQAVADATAMAATAAAAKTSAQAVANMFNAVFLTADAVAEASINYATALSSVSPTDITGAYAVYNSALDQAELMGDRFVIMDVLGAADTFRDRVISSGLKYGAAYYPKLKTILSYDYAEADVIVAGTFGVATLAGLKTTNSEVYNQAKKAIEAKRVIMAPSSAMAGVYAKVDGTSGVWKAPANLGLNYVVAPTVKISHGDQEGLNVDPTAGKSINAIRSFTGKGTLVWGARTLDGNSNEWRYISVRRFFNMVEESVKKATERFVFESNTANTWIRVQTMIENFLNQQWQAGALAGSKPEEAYYVSVGLNKTMSAQDILEGRMNIEIGMAAVRPAEFIILRFSHKLQES